MAASVLSHHTFELLESVIFNLPNDLEKLGELETEKRMLSNLRALRVCSLVKPPVQELKVVLSNIKMAAQKLIDKICPSSSGNQIYYYYLWASYKIKNIFKTFKGTYIKCHMMYVNMCNISISMLSLSCTIMFYFIITLNVCLAKLEIEIKHVFCGAALYINT